MNAELHKKIGRLYLKEGKMEAAKAAYERSLELDPCDPWTHLYLGNWHYTADENREAAKCFEYAAHLLSEIPVAFWCLGDAYAALGFDALATEHYRRALDMDPSDETARKRWQNWQNVYGSKG